MVAVDDGNAHFCKANRFFLGIVHGDRDVVYSITDFGQSTAHRPARLLRRVSGRTNLQETTRRSQTESAFLIPAIRSSG